MNFIIYDVVSGRITATGNAPATMVANQSYSGHVAIQGQASEILDYVLNDTIVKRAGNAVTIDKTNVKAYDQEIATLSGIPSGAKIYIMDDEYISDGTDIELTFYEIGSYKVRVDDFPKLDFEVTINAN